MEVRNAGINMIFVSLQSYAKRHASVRFFLGLHLHWQLCADEEKLAVLKQGCSTSS